jgi:hypothetical protein
MENLGTYESVMQRYYFAALEKAYACVDPRTFKRRFFTKSRIFLEKRSKHSDQAFAKKCCAAILVLKVSQNLGRKITEFYWIFGCVTRQNVVKYKENNMVSLISYLIAVI